MVLGGVGALVGAALSLGVALLLYVVPVNMPPPPGRSVGYPLNITIDPHDVPGHAAGHGAADHAGQLGLVARKTVHMPVVDALAHT
jgi:putative ABC transport system permease protein